MTQKQRKRNIFRKYIVFLTQTITHVFFLRFFFKKTKGVWKYICVMGIIIFVDIENKNTT